MGHSVCGVRSYFVKEVLCVDRNACMNLPLDASKGISRALGSDNRPWNRSHWPTLMHSCMTVSHGVLNRETQSIYVTKYPDKTSPKQYGIHIIRIIITRETWTQFEYDLSLHRHLFPVFQRVTANNLSGTLAETQITSESLGSHQPFPLALAANTNLYQRCQGTRGLLNKGADLWSFSGWRLDKEEI